MSSVPKKNRKIPAFTGILVLVVLLVFAAAGYKTFEASRAKQASAKVLSEFTGKLPNMYMHGEAEAALQDAAAAPSSAQELPAAEPEASLTQTEPVITIDGRDYVGMVDVPSFGLTIPVSSAFEPAALKLAGSRYAGTLAEDDLVVVLHDSRFSKSPIRELKSGAIVYFIAADGEVNLYEVSGISPMNAKDISELPLREDWDLTLITASGEGKASFMAGCIRIGKVSAKI